MLSHDDDTFSMTGPTPVVSPNTKRSREKEPYDDESEKLSNNGGKGRRFYIDLVGDRPSSPLFPEIVTPQQYQVKADQIQNPAIKIKFEEAVNRKVKFEEDCFISSPEGQRCLSEQGSRVYLRGGLLAKQTASRKEAEAGKIASDLAKVAREALDALHHRAVVDHKSLRVAVEERNNLLSANEKEATLRIKLHRTALDLEKADHELNQRAFKNKAPGSIAREDYRRREKVHTSLGFVFATLTGSYQRSEENNDTLRSTDRFLVKHGVEAVCVHCGSDLSLQSLFGSYVDNGNDFKDADPDSKSGESTLITFDEGGSSNGATRSQSSVESADDDKEAKASSEGGGAGFVELE